MNRIVTIKSCNMCPHLIFDGEDLSRSKSCSLVCTEPHILRAIDDVESEPPDWCPLSSAHEVKENKLWIEYYKQNINSLYKDMELRSARAEIEFLNLASIIKETRGALGHYKEALISGEEIDLKELAKELDCLSSWIQREVLVAVISDRTYREKLKYEPTQEFLIKIKNNY